MQFIGTGGHICCSADIFYKQKKKKTHTKPVWRSARDRYQCFLPSGQTAHTIDGRRFQWRQWWLSVVSVGLRFSAFAELSVRPSASIFGIFVNRTKEKKKTCAALLAVPTPSPLTGGQASLNLYRIWWICWYATRSSVIHEVFIVNSP